MKNTVQFPKRWTKKKLKYLFKQKSERGGNINELLSVYRDYGVIPKSSRDDNNNRPSEDLSNYKRVHKNDLVLNKMKTWQGSLGISKYNGIVSPAYHVCQPIETNIGEYIHYLLRSSNYINIYAKYSKGIRPNQWDLSIDDFLSFYIYTPPLPEQKQIAAFLDKKTTQIDTFIEKKQKMVELLKEKRSAIINHAVTKGLNPDAKMKPSGIDWLGDIPEGWEEVRAKSIISYFINGAWGENPQNNINDVLCVRVADFDYNKLSIKENASTLRNICDSLLSTRILGENDLLIEKSGGGDNQPVGRVVKYDIEKVAVCSNFIGKISVNSEKAISNFIVYVFASIYQLKLNVRSIKQTTGIQNLDINSYFQERIPLPPLPEQKQIAAFLDKKTAQIDKFVEMTNKQIELLKEYRTTLISDVVTGKVDVRDEVTA